MRSPAHPASIGAVMAAAALASLSTQLLLPALPLIAREGGHADAMAQALVSATFLVIAFATFAWGTSADRIGRRPVILLGLGLYVGGNLLCLFAEGLAAMLAGRVIQALGGSAGLVLASVILRDLYAERVDAAVARMNIVTTMVPMFAPLTIGILLTFVHWKVVFALPLVIGALVLAVLVRMLPETRDASRPRQKVSLFTDAHILLRNRAFVPQVAFSALFMALFFAFQAGAPRLALEQLGASPTTYGTWFMIAAVGYASGNVVAVRLARLGRLRAALVPAAAAAVLSAVAATVWLEIESSMAAMFVPLISIAFFGAIAMTAAHARAVSVDPVRTGTASALLVLSQMTFAAIATQAVAFLPADGAALYAFLSALGGSGLVALSFGRRSRGAALAAETA